MMQMKACQSRPVERSEPWLAPVTMTHPRLVRCSSWMRGGQPSNWSMDWLRMTHLNSLSTRCGSETRSRQTAAKRVGSSVSKMHWNFRKTPPGKGQCAIPKLESFLLPGRPVLEIRYSWPQRCDFQGCDVLCQAHRGARFASAGQLCSCSFAMYVRADVPSISWRQSRKAFPERCQYGVEEGYLRNWRWWWVDSPSCNQVDFAWLIRWLFNVSWSWLEKGVPYRIGYYARSDQQLPFVRKSAEPQTDAEKGAEKKKINDFDIGAVIGADAMTHWRCFIKTVT